MLIFPSMMKKFCISVLLVALLSTTALASPLFWGVGLVLNTTKLSLVQSVDLPIVMYHGVSDEFYTETPFMISVEMFQNDLEYLQNNGYSTIFVADLIDFVYNGIPLPQNPILLTFDDGYTDNYTNVYPLLQSYGMKGIICPVGKYFDADHPTDYGHFTGEQALEMVHSGVVELQSHSYDLHRWEETQGVVAPMDVQESVLVQDVDSFADTFDRLGLPQPTTFSYPYGNSTPETEAILKHLGFQATFVTAPATFNTISWKDPDCLFGLARMNRDQDLSTADFFEQLFTMNSDD